MKKSITIILSRGLLLGLSLLIVTSAAFALDAVEAVPETPISQYEYAVDQATAESMAEYFFENDQPTAPIPQTLLADGDDEQSRIFILRLPFGHGIICVFFPWFRWCWWF